MKNILIIGSGGFIGSAIAERMRQEDGRMNMVFGTSSSGRPGLLALDVTDMGSVLDLRQWLVKNGVCLHAMIYAAGSCKEGGFQEEMTTARRDMDPDVFKKKSELFGLGLMYVMIGLLSRVENGGHVVVISSATEAEKPPYYLSDRPHRFSIAAQEVLISSVREDRLTLGRQNIRMHRIAPGAVRESPFYNGVAPELLPRRMVSVSEVADAVMQAINMPWGYMDTNFFADADTE